MSGQSGQFSQKMFRIFGLRIVISVISDRVDALLLRNRVTEMHLFYYQEKYGLQGLQQFLPEYDTKIPPIFVSLFFTSELQQY